MPAPSPPGMAGFVDVAGCPISTPPDDLCLYHCISFARNPDLYASIPRSDAGHFIGERASDMTLRATSIRDELIALLRAISMALIARFVFELACHGDFSCVCQVGRGAVVNAFALTGS